MWSYEATTYNISEVKHICKLQTDLLLKKESTFLYKQHSLLKFEYNSPSIELIRLYKFSK